MRFGVILNAQFNTQEQEMTPELIAYLQRAVVALTGVATPEQQVKILRVVSQMTAKAAIEIEQQQLLEDIENA